MPSSKWCELAIAGLAWSLLSPLLRGTPPGGYFGDKFL
jgi:hypothetical protein